jgi:hypothetical protein
MERISNSLGIERNVAAASGAVFLVGLGEELWKKVLPKYLESLGASVVAVGVFGTAEDFFDAIYHLHRWGPAGDRRAVPKGHDCGFRRTAVPGSAIGGLLWRVRPEIPFVTAGLIGIAGTLLFAVSVEEQHDS